MKYSIVVPIYNDGYLALAFCNQISAVMIPLAGTSGFELIFINDGSSDESLEQLRETQLQFHFVRVMDLSRNFGQHAAIACGLQEAAGDVVLRMNVDMQDPPYEIPKLVRVLESDDYDLVVGVYSVRESPLIDRASAWLYYTIFRLLTGFAVPQNTSSLRAMSRRFVNAYNGLTEKSRFPQGLDQWLGFKQKYIQIEHQPRIDKRSSYTFWSRLKLGLDGVLYFTNRPLQIVAYGGLLMSAIGLVLAMYIILDRWLGNAYLPGFAAITSVSLVAFGLQVFCIGIVGTYVAKIFREVQNRPLFLIRQRF